LATAFTHHNSTLASAAAVLREVYADVTGAAAISFITIAEIITISIQGITSGIIRPLILILLSVLAAILLLIIIK
jgi:hypothetical protein